MTSLALSRKAAASATAPGMKGIAWVLNHEVRLATSPIADAEVAMRVGTPTTREADRVLVAVTCSTRPEVAAPTVHAVTSVAVLRALAVVPVTTR